MPAKVDEFDYINFLIAAQRVFTCTEASRSQPADCGDDRPAHDAFTRLLERIPPDTEDLWSEAKNLVKLDGGAIVMDDTTLDKPYAEKMDLVTYHWSGKHHDVVKGLNLITTLWTNGKRLIPCDFRIYDKPFGGEGKNEHFRDMLTRAKERGFGPRYVLFDSWYSSSLDNLKHIREFGWRWLARLKENRMVNPDGKGNVPIGSVQVPPEGRVVHLRGYGFVRVFRTVSRDGDVECWASDDLYMKEGAREELAGKAWGIEVYHRGIKQSCGVERAHARKEIEQRNHISLSLRAFLRLELHRSRTGVSWYETKASLIRGAIRSYLSNPTLLLGPTA
jgi:putative transposase